MNPPASGIVEVPSRHSFDDTVALVEELVRAKGLTLFGVVDHAQAAQTVGLAMPPTKVLIFGSPKAGTPLMLAAPSVAIDLPLKIVVAEDGGGRVLVSYNSPEWLRARHGFPEDLVANIAGIEGLANSAAG